MHLQVCRQCKVEMPGQSSSFCCGLLWLRDKGKEGGRAPRRGPGLGVPACPPHLPRKRNRTGPAHLRLQWRRAPRRVLAGCPPPAATRPTPSGRLVPQPPWPSPRRGCRRLLGPERPAAGGSKVRASGEASRARRLDSIPSGCCSDTHVNRRRCRRSSTSPRHASLVIPTCRPRLACSRKTGSCRNEEQLIHYMNSDAFRFAAACSSTLFAMTRSRHSLGAQGIYPSLKQKSQAQTFRPLLS